MTMPYERSRALLQAGGFLIELARDASLPLEIRQRAVAIARHFPTVEDIATMALFRHSSGLGMGLETPNDTTGWFERCKHGPLRGSTRLEWPEEPRLDRQLAQAPRQRPMALWTVGHLEDISGRSQRHRQRGLGHIDSHEHRHRLLS